MSGLKPGPTPGVAATTGAAATTEANANATANGNDKRADKRNGDCELVYHGWKGRTRMRAGTSTGAGLVGWLQCLYGYAG